MPIAEAFAALLLGAAGVFLLMVAAWFLRRRAEIARWPHVDAQVIGHELRSSRKHHRPLLRARYHLGARTFVHLVDSPTRSGYQKSDAAARELARFPVGSTVSLYVHPEDGEPAYRTLPELTSVVALIVGGLLFVAVGLLGLAAAF